jgi:hypothetical protein
VCDETTDALADNEIRPGTFWYTKVNANVSGVCYQGEDEHTYAIYESRVEKGFFGNIWAAMWNSWEYETVVKNCTGVNK